MTVDAVCERLKQIEGLEPSMLPQYCATIRKVSRPCLPGGEPVRAALSCALRVPPHPPPPAAAVHAGMGQGWCGGYGQNPRPAPAWSRKRWVTVVWDGPGQPWAV